MLLDKHREEAADNILRHVLDSRVRAHQNGAARFIFACEKAGGSGAHRTAEAEHLFIMIAEAALTPGSNDVLKYLRGTLLDQLMRATELLLFINFSILYLMREKTIARVLHC